MLTAALAMKSDVPPQEESHHTTERMADIIAERIKIKGSCPIAEIQAVGFSLNDIARYWEEANKLAATKRSRS